MEKIKVTAFSYEKVTDLLEKREYKGNLIDILKTDSAGIVGAVVCEDKKIRVFNIANIEVDE